MANDLVEGAIWLWLGFVVEHGFDMGFRIERVHELELACRVEIGIAPAEPEIEVHAIGMRAHVDRLDVIDIHPDHDLPGPGRVFLSICGRRRKQAGKSQHQGEKQSCNATLHRRAYSAAGSEVSVASGWGSALGRPRDRVFSTPSSSPLAGSSLLAASRFL